MNDSLQLTDGDIEVFWYLWMLQVITLDQVRRLRYFREGGNGNAEKSALSHPDNVRKRLARLMKSGYLIGDDIWTEVTRKRVRIYRLGKEALVPLRQHRGIEQTRIHKPKEQNTFRQVYHSLLVSECAVRIVEGLREHREHRGNREHVTVEASEAPESKKNSFEAPALAPLKIPFYVTHTVGKAEAKKHTERYVSQVDVYDRESMKTYRIRPDLVFALGKDGIYRLFFLEADRGSESVQEIAEKIAGYHVYASTRDPLIPDRFLWERYGQCRDFRVLFVTTSVNRLHLLREKLASVKGFELVAFALESDISSLNMVFGEVWYVGRERAIKKCLMVWQVKGI